MAGSESLDETENFDGHPSPTLNAAPRTPLTSRSLLFGQLAVLNGIVEQEALDKASRQQAKDPSRSIAETLVQSGALSEDGRHVIDQMLDLQLAQHCNDPDLPTSSTDHQSAARYDDTIAFAPKPTGEQHSNKRFGEYELLSEIARGGMGVVYKARQAKLNRLVALKMIRSGELADEEQVKRFYAEAEAAAKLDHPGIVPVYEVGETNGQHFFSMALVVGTSLNGQVKSDGPLPPVAAARLLRSVVEAVEYAHGKGIIHRDVKPQNILLDESGQPRLTDFGLAKQVKGQSELTASGQIMGTPSYMPPEQASGKLDEIGPASDVYSLGATLYFALTGRPPFQTASVAETIRQVLDAEPVALRRLNPAIPRDLETICLKCLRKDSRQRYPGAITLCQDLDRFLDGRPILARPIGAVERTWKWARRRPQIAALLALCSLTLAVLGGVVAWSNLRLRQYNANLVGERDNAQRQERRASAKEMEARQSEEKAKSAQSLAEERELVARQHGYAGGLNLAYQAYQLGHVGRVLERLREQVPLPGQSDLREFEWYCLWRLCHNDRQTLFAHGANINCIAWSRDGARLATGSADRTVCLWNANTGKLEQTLKGHTENVFVIAFSPDGKLLVSGSCYTYSGSNDAEIRIWNTHNGQPAGVLSGHKGGARCLAFDSTGKQLASGGNDNRIRLWSVSEQVELATLEEQQNWVTALAFSSDDKTLISGSFDGKIRLWDAAEHKISHELFGHEHCVHNLTLAPDGNTLASRSTDGTVRFWDLAQRKQLGSISAGGEGGLAFSPDGKVLAVPGRPITLWNVADRKRIGELVGHHGLANQVAFSPDGTRLASAGDDATARLWDMPVEPIAAGGHTDAVVRAVYSPDESMVATASLDNTIQLWDKASATSVRTLADHTYQIFGLAYSPDGKWLASGALDKHVKLWDPSTGKREFNINWGHEAHGIAFPPQGPQVAFCSGTECLLFDIPKERTGVTTMHRFVKQHEKAIISTAFSPDGMLLATGDLSGKIVLWDVATKKHLAELSGHEGVVFEVAFSPDGLTLASASKDRTVRTWSLPSGEPLQTMRGPVGYARGVAWSPDGETLATCWAAIEQEPSIWIWKSKTGQLVRSFNTRNESNSIVYSRDGSRVLVGVRNSMAQEWDPSTGLQKQMYARREGVWSCRVSPDGKTLAVGGHGRVRLIDTVTNEERCRLTGITWLAHDLAFSPDSSTLAVAESNWPGIESAGAKLYEVATGKPLGELSEQTGGVLAVAFSPDGATLATGGHEATNSIVGEVQLWNVKTREPKGKVTKLERVVHSLVFTPDGQYIAAGTADFYLNVSSQVKLWNVATQQESLSFSTPRGVNQLAVSPSGRYLAIAGADQMVGVWDLRDRRQLVNLEGHTQAVTCLSFLGSDRRLASGGADGTIRFWDLTTKQELGSMLAKTYDVRSLAFCPRKQVLYSGNASTTGKGAWVAWSAGTGSSEAGPKFGISTKGNSEGLVVTQVDLGSGAHLADIRLGDVLLKVSDQSVGRAGDLGAALHGRRSGEIVEVELLREGARLMKKVTLGSY